MGTCLRRRGVNAAGESSRIRGWRTEPSNQQQKRKTGRSRRVRRGENYAEERSIDASMRAGRRLAKTAGGQGLRVSGRPTSIVGA